MQVDNKLNKIEVDNVIYLAFLLHVRYSSKEKLYLIECESGWILGFFIEAMHERLSKQNEQCDMFNMLICMVDKWGFGF